MTTWKELIVDSLLELGVISLGEQVDVQQSDWALRKCELMLESWAADMYLIPGYERIRYTVLVSSDTFHIGPGLTIDSDLPPYNLAIVNHTRSGADKSSPLVRYSLREFEDLRIGSYTGVGTTPTAYYYERQETRGVLRVNIGLSRDDTLQLIFKNDIPGAHPTRNSGEDEITLPAGYRRAIIYNLAVELAPGFSVMPQNMTLVERLAAGSRGDLRVLQADHMSTFRRPGRQPQPAAS